MKIFKKILRILCIVVAVILGIIILFIAVSVAPVDRTPVQQYPAYVEMMGSLNHLDTLKGINTSGEFSVGYSEVNITPASPTATAGYGKRRGVPYSEVKDSIFVRSLVVSNGSSHVAIVSADLLIIPPLVTEKLRQSLPAIGFTLNNTYLGATHSHNSIGNWAKGAAQFIYGTYSDTVVNFITEAIIESIRKASSNLQPSVIKTIKFSLDKPVRNRLADSGPVDNHVRGLAFHCSDSTKLLFITYTAHATCLFSKDNSLSGDYPGKLVANLKANGYDFAMFMAGAVGSHGCSPPQYGDACIDWMADTIAGEVVKHAWEGKRVDSSALVMKSIALPLGDPQVKISKGWKVRSWLFRLAFGEYPSYLKALRIGDVMLLGTPCDYSGEFNSTLDSVATALNKQCIVTSFNGGYIGYVTPRKYYDFDHYETQLMNWYPPGNGEYITESLRKLIVVMATD